MTELKPMARYAKRVARDAAIARRRSLDRQLGGPLVWKYVQVVPTVFTARGEFTAFKLLVPVEEVSRRLSDSAVLTLDSATERLGGFRFGRGRHLYAYFGAASDLELLATDAIGQPVNDHLVPWLSSPHEQSMLFAVVCDNLPPYSEEADCRLVTRAHLIRDLLGFYGLRRDLLVEIENKLNDTD
jgi:hypothetical protein